MNATNDKNNFTLARRPYSAVEKAAPGAKRILSGMVTDTLALAKPVFTVLLQDGEGFCLSAEVIIKSEWGQKLTLRFIRFGNSAELLKLTREHSFDLLLLHLGVLWDAGAGAVEFLGQIKARYGKPIVAAQGIDRRELFEGTGITFMELPLSLEGFREFLKANFAAQYADPLALAKKKPSPRIVVVDDDEFMLEIFSMLVQWSFKEVTLLRFQDSESAWQELSRTDPDLLILDMPLVEPELLPLLTVKKVKYPILATSGLFDEKQVLECADPNLNVSFIPKPFDPENFRKALEKALKIKIPRDSTTPDKTKPIKNLAKIHKPRGKLLVVDDEDGPRQSLRVIFEDEYDLFLAEDGPTATKLAQENNIDVVVTNIRMPGMSGIELLERLKILNPDIEVIISTAFETTETLLNALRLRASDYINKPFKLEAMRAAVSKAMQRHMLAYEKSAARKKSSSNLEKVADLSLFKRRGRLLIVDGEDGPRQSLRVIFEDEYDLFLAEDGPTAIKLAQENEIDVVVTDTLAGRGMSGLEVLERVKYIEPDIEVIIMTAFETNDLIRESLRLGACDYINKPFDIETIRAAVSKAMRIARTQAK